MEVVVDGLPRLHDFFAPLRFHIERRVLERLTPDPAASLTDEGINRFAFWLAARVQRRAFPNAFDARLGTDNHNKVRKALRPINSAVEALLYSLSTETELDPHDAYRVRVVLLVKESALKETRDIEAIEAAKDRIEEILSGKEGIVLERISVASAARMSVADFLLYRNWGFEDLSMEE